MSAERAAEKSSVVDGSSEHLVALFMQAPVPICVLRGREHVFELVNPSFRRLLGDRDLLGSTVRASVPEIEGQGFFELLDAVFESGERYVGSSSSALLKRAHDDTLQEFVLDFVIEPFREPDRRVGGLLIVAHDITETFRAREALERALQASAKLNEEVSEARNELMNLVDNLPELAWSARPDGYIDFCNKRWYEYTGGTVGELRDRGWDKVHDPDLLPKIIERWRRSLQTGDPFEMEFPLRGADGNFRWFLTRVRPMRDRTGQIVRWLGMNTDIHDQREANRKAEAASLAKDEFLSTASHELRTPLNAILGWAHLLRGGTLDAGTTLRAIESIERNARAQVRLIEDILDGSRIITGKLRLEIRALDMAELVQAALDAVKPAAQAKSIALSLALDPSAARVVGDPERLQQVVWNLVNNAVKFTPKEGSIAVALERAGAHIELSVSDSGQGISAEFLPYVFDRFRQAEGTTTRRFGGLGLGLALVRHLVEAHGGTVSAASDGLGHGSRFVVQLPMQAVYRPPVSEERAVESSAALSAPPADSLTGVRLLVVDDESDTRDLVATILRGAGARVTTAASAAEALDFVVKTNPALVISDIGMPDIDGYELMRRLRKLGGLMAEIPAIALTAYARDQDRRLAVDAGFQTHVAKPVDPQQLLRVVSTLLRSARRRTTHPERETALERVDSVLKFERMLAARGLGDALQFLNSRTGYRFTAINRFDPPSLRNVLLIDAYSPAVVRGDDAPMTESYCAIVGQSGVGFSTEDTRLDERLREHPARDAVISYSGILLRDEHGERYGTVCHFDLVPCEVPVRELALMEAVAPLLVRAVKSAS